jgi:hypothetical protein
MRPGFACTTNRLDFLSAASSVAVIASARGGVRVEDRVVAWARGGGDRALE